MYILLILIILLILYYKKTEHFFSNKIVACNQSNKAQCTSNFNLSKNKKKCPPVWRCNCDKDV